MSDLIIHGGQPLEGTIIPSGNKNSVLPILCASLLSETPIALTNVPGITDIEKLVRFFRSIGSKIEWNQETGEMSLDHSEIAPIDSSNTLPQEMRSAVLLFAPLLHRFKRIELRSDPKGCTLGIRELDPHLEILSNLGAEIAHENGGIIITLKDRFKGCDHWADYMSVTSTENFLMAAAVAHGPSSLTNAASEPHVQDLTQFLIHMGAQIQGTGASLLKVQGVDTLSGSACAISTDHHEVATFLALGAITGGEVRIEKSDPHHFALIDRAFQKLGVEIEREGEAAIVKKGQTLKIKHPFTPNLLPRIEAAPWPYFPVDLLPPMIALATRAEGTIQFWNKIYEGGFMWLPEMVKFGAHVVISDPHRVIVFGNTPLRPAVVEAPYIIRAAVALYMTAASIPGQSRVKNADTIRRAHPNFVENLQRLGANIEWDE